MKKIYKILSVIAITMGLLTGCDYTNNKKYTIVSTSFPGYDFSRAIVKNSQDVDVKMLLKPGGESHTFEPTPNDIKTIKKSDIFIYVGGDSDEWVNKILNNINPKKTKVVKLIDLVDAKEEVLSEGMEDEGENEEENEVELDEHVWTSPQNAIQIIKKLRTMIVHMNPNEKNDCERNSQKYIKKLNKIDLKFKDIVEHAKRKEIIVGDRFPLRYFVDEYGLDYYAAFPGCSEQTEASAQTISFLTKKVRNDHIPVILKIELSNGNIAQTIAQETNTKVLEFNSAHNISQKDFDAGMTYVDIMNKNVKVLKEALN